MIRKVPMTRCLLTLPLLGALLVGCPAPSPVDEIVNSNITARGGVERLQALQSIRMTGTATASGGRVARVVLEMKRPGLYRLEFSSQGTTAVFAHDGEVGWQVDPLAGVFEPEQVVPERDSEAGVDERDIEGHLVNWRDKGHSVVLVGREALAGGEAFKLEVTLASGAVRHDYVDVASRQIVRSDKTETIGGRTLRLEETYADFREVGGLVFPHRIETHVIERPEVITIVVESIELDPELDAARFEMP
jgi:outer membrane lipoprotein-sorting protein